MRKNNTYLGKLMKNKKFRNRFKEKYQIVCIGEQITKAGYKANF